MKSIEIFKAYSKRFTELFLSLIDIVPKTILFKIFINLSNFTQVNSTLP